MAAVHLPLAGEWDMRLQVLPPYLAQRNPLDFDLWRDGIAVRKLV
jgi:hypothetical protein